MAYGLRFGNPFTPGVGESLHEGSRNKENFARGIERSKLRVQNRQLDIQEAQLALSEKHSELAELREKRVTDQSEREFAENARRWKSQRKDTRRGQKLNDRREDRMDTDLDFRKEEAGRDRRNQEIERKDQTRKEQFAIGQMGGQPLRDKERPPPGYFAYRSGDGRRFAVPDAQRRAADQLSGELMKIRERNAGKSQSAKMTDYQRQKISNLKSEITTLQKRRENDLKRREHLHTRLKMWEKNPKEAKKIRGQLAQIPTDEQYRTEIENRQKEIWEVTNALGPEDHARPGQERPTAVNPPQASPGAGDPLGGQTADEFINDFF